MGRAPKIEGRVTPRAGGGGARVFRRRALRDLDFLATEEFGIPSIVLMENAGRAVAEVALELLSGTPGGRVLVVAGPGNNGGDGLVALRHLSNAGLKASATIAAMPEAYTGDAAVNLGIVRKMGLEVCHGPAACGETPDLVIDALFGTGLTRPIVDPAAALVRTMAALRSAGACVLSIDIPSGLDADTGDVLGCAVAADVTVSLVGMKTGFTALAAQEYLGEVVIADIGVPAALMERLGEPLAAHGHDVPDAVGDEGSGQDAGEERPR